MLAAMNPSGEILLKALSFPLKFESWNNWCVNPHQTYYCNQTICR